MSSTFSAASNIGLNPDYVPSLSGGGGGAVDSVFSRTGIVVAVAGDYNSSQVTNSSGVTGATVTDALNTLNSGKLSTSLTSANIIVGNGSNVATAVAMSGDITISNTGATTISNNAVTTAKILDANVTLGKLQDIGQHKLLGRHDTGTGIVHQIGVTNGIEFNAQNIGLTAVGTAGTYGSATQVPVLTTDTQGRITGVTDTAITGFVPTTLTSGNIIVGNGSNVATAVAMSGDITISNTGATTIGNAKVKTANILDRNVTFGKLQDLNPNSLIGRGSVFGAAQEITLGTNLSITGTTLNAAGGGGYTYLAITLSVNTSYNKAALAGANYLFISTNDATTRTITIDSTGFAANDFLVLSFNEASPGLITLIIGTTARTFTSNRGNTIFAVYNGTEWSLQSMGNSYNTGATFLNSLSLGLGADAGTQNDSLVIGNNTAGGFSSVNIGHNQDTASANTAIHIGNDIVASGNTGVRIGEGSTGTGNNCTTVGWQITTGANTGVVAIGQSITSTNTDAVVIGRGAGSGSTDSVVIGALASAPAASTTNTVIGYSASVTNGANVSIGRGATAAGTSVTIGSSASSGATSVVIGASAASAGSNTIAIGSGVSTSTNTGVVAIGQGIITTNVDAVIIGRAASGSGTSNVTVGASSTGTGANSVRMGHTAVTGNASAIVAIGQGVTIGNGGNNTVAIGQGVNIATNTGVVAIGQGITTTNTDAVVIGRGAGAAGTGNVTIGALSTGTGNDVIRIGRNINSVGSNSSVYIGGGITNASSVDTSIVMGTITLPASNPTNRGGNVFISSSSSSVGTVSQTLSGNTMIGQSNSIGVTAGTTSSILWNTIIGNSNQTTFSSTPNNYVCEYNVLLGTSNILRPNTTAAFHTISRNIVIGNGNQLDTLTNSQTIKSIVIGNNNTISNSVASQVFDGNIIIGKDNATNRSGNSITLGNSNTTSIEGNSDILVFGINNSLSQNTALGSLYNISIGFNIRNDQTTNNIRVFAKGAYAFPRHYGVESRRIDTNVDIADTTYPSRHSENTAWNGITTDATANVELFLFGVSNSRLSLQNNEIITATIHIQAKRNTTNDCFVETATVSISRGATAAATIMVGAGSFTASGTNGTATGIAYTLDADTSNGALRLRVTGRAGETWHWTGNIITYTRMKTS